MSEIDDLEGMREFRRKHFAVEVGPSRSSYYPTEFEVSVTKNGFQYQTLALTPEEAERVISAIQEHLNSL